MAVFPTRIFGLDADGFHAGLSLTPPESVTAAPGAAIQLTSESDSLRTMVALR